MRKIFSSIVATLSIISALGSAIWLILFTGYLLSTKGTYSITLENGGIACGIPFFRSENWDGIFYLIIAPILILIVSFFLARYSIRNFSADKLP